MSRNEIECKHGVGHSCDTHGCDGCCTPKDEVKITSREIIAFFGILIAMVGSLIYGFYLIKKESVPTPSPTPMSCWEQYQDAGEEVAIRMCEVGQGE